MSRLSDRYVSAKELLHGQLDACRVRGIVLTPSQGFARGMTVDEASGLLTERDGKTFYFCGEPCRQKFLFTPPVLSRRKSLEAAADNTRMLLAK